MRKRTWNLRTYEDSRVCTSNGAKVSRMERCSGVIQNEALDGSSLWTLLGDDIGCSLSRGVSLGHKAKL